MKKTTLRYIIIKIIQNQLLEENQGVKNITFERNEQKMTAEPSWEALWSSRQWNNTLEVQKGKKLSILDTSENILQK